MSVYMERFCKNTLFDIDNLFKLLETNYLQNCKVIKLNSDERRFMKVSFLGDARKNESMTAS